MGYKFFNKRFLVMPDDKNVIDEKVFYADTLSTLIRKVESGDFSKTAVLDNILDSGRVHSFVIDGVEWRLVYYDPNYEAKVAYSQGQKIQVKLSHSEDWVDTDSPVWVDSNEYRVKLETADAEKEELKQVESNIYIERATELLKKFIYLLKEADYVFVLKNTPSTITDAEKFLRDLDNNKR